MLREEKIYKYIICKRNTIVRIGGYRSGFTRSYVADHGDYVQLLEGDYMEHILFASKT